MIRSQQIGVRSLESGVRNSSFGYWILNLLSLSPRRFPRPAGWLLLAVLVAQTAAAQLGPYPIRTKQTSLEASLVKRDGDILWVERKSANGLRAPQIGLPVADIVQIQMPRPAFFDAVENAPRPPPPRRSLLRPFRARQVHPRPACNLPGIRANEAILLKVALDMQGLWREALRYYEMSSPRPPARRSPPGRRSSPASPMPGPGLAVRHQYLGAAPCRKTMRNCSPACLRPRRRLFASRTTITPSCPTCPSWSSIRTSTTTSRASPPPRRYAKLREWEPLSHHPGDQENYPGTPPTRPPTNSRRIRNGSPPGRQFVDAATSPPRMPPPAKVKP